MGKQKSDLIDLNRLTSDIIETAPLFLPEIPLPEDLPREPVAISDMANLFGVTHRTLHFYEEKNLLPARRIGLMRVYYLQDILRMAVINTCREIGMPVATIQELMSELQGVKSQDDANVIFKTAVEARKRELIAAQSLIMRQMQQVQDLLLRDEDAAEGYVNEDTDQTRALFHGIEFTLAEQHCLVLMAEGYTKLRIARTLHEPVETIAAIEASIMRKMRATNRFQAVAKALLLGLVTT